MLFIVIALVVSFLLLLFIYQSYKAALLPYLISVTSLIWLLGIMSLSGKSISILGSLIPPIILFVSTSDAIHFLNAYKKSKKKQPTLRLLDTFKKVLFPTFLTSLTTAIGFVSLIVLSTEPVEDLGVFTGIGVGIAFVITFLFAPLIISDTPMVSQNVISFKQWCIFILRYPKLIITSTVVLAVVSFIGMALIEVDTKLLDDLPNDSQVKTDFNYVEKEFHGFKPWELAYWPATDSIGIWDQNMMDEVAKIISCFNETNTFERVVSPLDFIKISNQAISGGINSAYKYPVYHEYDRVLKTAKNLASRDSASLQFISKGEDYARVVAFVPEIGAKAMITVNEDLKNTLDSLLNPSIIQYQITGTTQLIDQSHSLLSANLVKGLLIAIGLVSVILGLYFKSFKILIFSLIPNLIPLIVTAGFMGFADIPLKLTTSIIFTVAFGIAVDDTIHFISAFQIQPHQRPIYRLLATFKSAGTAIVVTSLVLLAGFFILLFSSFGATYYLGLFLCIAIGVALFIDLTLLPLLLIASNKKRNSQFPSQ